MQEQLKGDYFYMNKILKKFNIVLVLLALVCLSGCDGNIGKNDGDKIKVVCTTFPQYDWVREIAGENIENIDLILLGGGADLHSYQPSTGDVVTISDCDIFIYVGGMSDNWVDDVLRQASNKDMIVINMMDILSDKLYEEEHDHDAEHNHEEDDLIEYDEHVWLSIKNAIVICEEIRDALVSTDDSSESKQLYEDNCKTYIEELELMDKEYKNVVDNAKYDTLLFGDRFPFIYMVEDYDLNYYAAFLGCSSDSEASIETIAFLAGKMDELELPAILVVDGSTTDLAKTIAESTKNKNYPILEMDSLQIVTEDEMNNGKNYIDTMKANLDVLRQALKSE